MKEVGSGEGGIAPLGPQEAEALRLNEGLELFEGSVSRGVLPLGEKTLSQTERIPTEQDSSGGKKGEERTKKALRFPVA